MRKPGILGKLGKFGLPIAAGFGIANWMQGDQAQQAGITEGPDGGLTQTVEGKNQWWDPLNLVGNKQEQVQVDTGQVSEMLQITKMPWMYSEDQVTEAQNFLKDPAGSGGTVQPTEQAVPGKEKKRGWWNRALGAVDVVTGGATDFDNMGSEGQIFNPISGGSDAKWGEEIGPVQEPPPQIIEIPAVNTSGLFPGGGGGGNTRGPVNTTPNISSNDSNNIYSMAAQTNFNVVSV